MANLYFNAAVDNDWATLGNWWADSACSIAAAALPTSADDVEIKQGTTVSSNSGSVPTVDTLVNNGSMTGISINLGVLSNYGVMTSCTVTGDPAGHSIYNYIFMYGVTVVGNLVNEGGSLWSQWDAAANKPVGPTVTGTLTNTQYSTVYCDALPADGYIGGAAVCEDFSQIISCNFDSTLDMYDSSVLYGFVNVNGEDVTFHDSSMHGGDIAGAGTIYFKDTSAGCFPYPYGSGGIGILLYHGHSEAPIVYQDNSVAFRYRGADPTLTQTLGLINGVFDWPTGPSATFDETAILATMADSMGGVAAVTYNIKRGINGSSILGVV